MTTLSFENMFVEYFRGGLLYHFQRKFSSKPNLSRDRRHNKACAHDSPMAKGVNFGFGCTLNGLFRVDKKDLEIFKVYTTT